MGGLSYLEYIRGLGKKVEEDWAAVQVGCAGAGSQCRWCALSAECCQPTMD